MNSCSGMGRKPESTGWLNKELMVRSARIGWRSDSLGASSRAATAWFLGAAFALGDLACMEPSRCHPRVEPLLRQPPESCENDGMTKTELHELVEGLPENTLDGAAVLLRGLSDGRIDPDQAWFWTSEWLSGELEADREAATDPGVVYEDADAFKAALQAVRAS